MADEQTQNGWDDFLKEAAKAALLGAALGAAVGAVTAASREALEEDDEEPQAQPDEGEPRAEADEESEAEAQYEEPEAEEHEEPAAEAEHKGPEEYDEPEAEADEEQQVVGEEPRQSEEDQPAPAGLAVVRRAQSQLAQLTGRQIEGVLGMEETDGGWRVTVEVVEVARVPSSTDVLAAYEVLVSESGDVQGWHRTRRYIRSRPESEGVA